MNDHNLSWRDRLQFDRRPMPLIRTVIVSVFWIAVTAVWLGFTKA